MDQNVANQTGKESRARTIEFLQQNWLAESRGARLYRELADAERGEKRKTILIRMAEAEERHAKRWEQKLLEMGATVPVIKDGLRGRLRRWINRRLGTELAIRRMEAAEDRDIARYASQQHELVGHDPEVAQVIHDTEMEERSHQRALQAMQSPAPTPQGVLDRILKRERWHGRGGGWVADAIYGVNDGLGAVFGIVSGVAGALENNRKYILISGLAGMIASALSMGAGAYLAVKSEREVHEAEIAMEKREIEENPEEEIEELALFYQLQGFSEEEAMQMARKVAGDPDQMLRIMSQNELGLAEEHFRNPWLSAFSAMMSTAIGAFVPIIPFFFFGGLAAVITAFIISLVAHFAVGAGKSLITNRSWWSSGLEMTFVGVLEAAVTYGLGFLFGAVG